MIINKYKIIAIIILLIIIIIISFVGFKSISYNNELKIITGPTSGSFYKLALDYKEILVERGFKVDIETVSSTSELAQYVNNSEYANTISLTIPTDDVSVLKNVRSLGIVSKQPIFIFYNFKKNGLIKNLSVLKGKRILLLPKSSITTILSMKILKLHGINEENSTIEFSPLSEMYSKMISGDYDVGFVQLTTDNPLISQLALNKDLKLYSHDNADAILNKIIYLDFAQLSMGSFDILSNTPSQDVSLLVGNVEVIANKNIDNSIVYTLLENFESLHSQRTFISKAGDFPKHNGTQFKLHEVIQEYKKSGTPWFYKNFTPFYAMIINNYSIYFVILFSLIQFYKSIGYFHEFMYLCVEYLSLKIIEKNHIRIKSSQPLGYLRQIVHGWAVDAIERKTIRQKAVKMIVELKDQPK
jgi:TRAP-type uncharacterized transport system substrate-binding protein